MMKRIMAGMVATLGISLAGSAVADEKWFPSKWGPDDELGAANYLSPDKVLAASRLITTGKTYALGVTVKVSIAKVATTLQSAVTGTVVYTLPARLPPHVPPTPSMW